MAIAKKKSAARQLTRPSRRAELRAQSAQAVLDLLASGMPLDLVTVPMIAAKVGFSAVYISTRVGLSDAKADAIQRGLAEKHPQLLCQLALQGDRRTKSFPSTDLIKAFRLVIAA